MVKLSNNKPDLQVLKNDLNNDEKRELIKNGKKGINEQREQRHNSEAEEEKEKKKNQADELLYLVDNFDTFCDELGKPYIVLDIGAHKEVYEVNSEKFKTWLSLIYRKEYQKMPANSSVESVVKHIKGKAFYGGQIRKLDVRVAEYDQSIWYDLTNSDWSVVRINGNGWQVVNDPPIIFKRFKLLASQISPAPTGDIRLLFKFINLKKSQKLLFLVYIISLFIPSISHPICVLYGEKGAAKTTTSRIIKSIIDPSIVETMTLNRDHKELVQLVSHTYLCAFDNLTSISNEQSDILCRAVTGEGFMKRKLFEDDDDILYSFRRCILINGINIIPTKEDLLDRSILFELQRIESHQRKEEIKLWMDFKRDLPQILAGIFEVISKAMIIYPSIMLNDLYRLSDFTRWGYAIAEALGEKGEDFLVQYKACQKRLNEEAIISNPVTLSILLFMNGKTEWQGKTSELLVEAFQTAQCNNIDIRGNDCFKQPNNFTREIKKMRGNLADIGIIFEVKHTMTGNIIKLYKTPSYAS